MKLPCILGAMLTVAFTFGCKPSPKPQPTEGTQTLEVRDSTTEAHPWAGDKALVKASLDSILKKARLGDCSGMAPMLVFHEGDGDEVWHRGLRYENPSEKLAAEKECAKLQVLVTGLEAHEFLEFANEQEREGEWLIWKVGLRYQDGENDQKAFAFLKIGDQYLLGDID